MKKGQQSESGTRGHLVDMKEKSIEDSSQEALWSQEQSTETWRRSRDLNDLKEESVWDVETAVRLAVFLHPWPNWTMDSSASTSTKYYVGIDVGTASVRAALVDQEGIVVAVAEEAIQIWEPQPDHYEQSSTDIWARCCVACQKVMQGVDAREIRGIGFDATCSLVVLDKDFQPLAVNAQEDNLRNIIMWMDHRAFEQANEINQKSHRLLQYVGGVMSPEMQPPKLMWLKQCSGTNLQRATTQKKKSASMVAGDTRTWEQAGRSLCTLICKWTYSSETGWDDNFWESIGLEDLLEDGYSKIGSQVCTPGTPLGTGLTKEAAQQLGLREGTAVAASLIDAHAGGLDSPSFKAALQLALKLLIRMMDLQAHTVGDSSISEKPLFVPGVWGPYFSAMVPGFWLNEGGQSATGRLLDFIVRGHAAFPELQRRAEHSGENVYTFLNRRLEEIRGSVPMSSLAADLHVWPDFHGNRSPLADPSLKGMVVGLTLSQTLEDLARLYLATIQAVALGTRHILEAMRAAGHHIDALFMCGGLSKNQLFVQTHADVTGLPIVLSHEVESVLVGAAILGACASGDFTSIQMQTFSLPFPCTTVQNLTSGVAIAHVLHQIDPAWFSEAWLSRIKEDVGDNWRLKANNLKKILQYIVDYYNEVLMQQILDFPMPDLNQVAEHADHMELGRLLQLVLGCAVKCEKKHEYIQIIMTLEESVQHVVMTAIQELLSKETAENLPPEALGDVEQQLKKLSQELSIALSEKEELAQRCQELDIQVASLQEERNSLLAENDVLTDRANQLDSFDDPNTPSGRKIWQTQLQFEQLQEENFRLEAAKDDYRIHCEELEKQLIELQHRNNELTSLAEESRALKDELDVLRNCSDRVVKLEAAVETYRKKLEGLSDLRRQVKTLEDKNMMYMQNTVSLEEELRKANATRAQLETYKRQVQELHKKLADESRRADNVAFEKKQFEEKNEALLKERERLIIERDSLRETTEELSCTQAQQTQLFQAGLLPDGSPSHGNLASEMLPVEYREKFLRLQHENKMLRVQQQGSENERIAELQVMLEEIQRMKNELETELRLSQGRIRELQLQVEDLQKALQGQGEKAEDSHLKRKLDAHMEQLHEAKDEIMKNKELIEDLQPETVQSSLDPKLSPASAEIQTLKNMLAEKDKKILALERECEQAKLREYEEKLIVTAWNNKSLSFQKLAIESRLATRATVSGTPMGQSFLAQQRQVTNARRVLAVSMPSSISK
ncbi:HOOK1 protein, partial [Polypterus senegalus]